MLLAAAGCGKRGDPLPPLRPLPGRVEDLSVRRSATRLEVSFTVPAANADGTTPPAVDRIDLYARTIPAGYPAPTATQLMADPSNVVTRLQVRPAEAVQAAPPTAAAAPAVAPRRPGEAVLLVDPMIAGMGGPITPTVAAAPAAPTSAATSPAAIPPVPSASSPPAAAAGSAPVPPAPAALPAVATRYYVAIGVTGTGRGRSGPASPVVAVALGELPAAPAGVSATHDETRIILSWQPAGSGQLFRVFRTGATFDAASAEALTPAPIAETRFEMPVEFGRQSCFSIQALQVASAVQAEGVPSPPQCLLPTDSYPPPAPGGLRAIQEPDGITLLWTAVTAADLAGYIVIRGEATAQTLQPITGSPVTATTYRDTTAQPGMTYAYAVYAVDRASPPNVSAASERQVLTVR
jgi:hypothetical protein